MLFGLFVCTITILLFKGIRALRGLGPMTPVLEWRDAEARRKAEQAAKPVDTYRREHGWSAYQ